MKLHLMFLILALGLASCATTSASGTMVVDGEEVEYSADVTSEVDDIEVDHTIVRALDGRVSAQFELENDDSSPKRLTIKWDWMDADGIKLREATGEHSEWAVVLAPSEVRSFTLQSPTEHAIQVKIRVRSTRSTL
jgi:uncharacterized protein YcfL